MPIQRQLIFVLVIFLMCLLNTRRIFANSAMRTVDILSLIALGMTIGAGISIFSVYLRSRNTPA